MSAIPRVIPPRTAIPRAVTPRTAIPRAAARRALITHRDKRKLALQTCGLVVPTLMVARLVGSHLASMVPS